MLKLKVLALSLSVLVVGPAFAAETREFPSQNGTVRVTTIAEGLEHPWGMTFLPDGRMLVTERPGRLRIVSPDGTLSRPIAGVPRVAARGQGGLLDVALHPKFAENGWVYLSFSEAGSGGAGTSVARGKLEGDALTNVQVIFRQAPKVDTAHHFGSRLVFDRDGTLFVSSGDRAMQDNAQDLSKGQGKVFHITDDGTPVPNAALPTQADQHPAVWSYGHRNIQGMALHPSTGALWTHEHGPRGGDEINIAKAGLNYGWPVITYGVNYSGTTIGEGITEKAGMEQPLHQWTPSIGPSGLAFYSANRFPAWKGNAFVGSLSFTYLARLTLNGARVTGEEKLLDEWNQRIRDVRQGPDGALYVLTDARNGQVARVELLPR